MTRLNAGCWTDVVERYQPTKCSATFFHPSLLTPQASRLSVSASWAWFASLLITTASSLYIFLFEQFNTVQRFNPARHDKPSPSSEHITMNATAAAAATQSLLNWISAHPYQTCFHVVNGVVLLTPAAATVPVFSALGLSAGGPVAGTRIFT